MKHFGKPEETGDHVEIKAAGVKQNVPFRFPLSFHKLFGCFFFNVKILFLILQHPDTENVFSNTDLGLSLVTDNKTQTHTPDLSTCGALCRFCL